MKCTTSQVRLRLAFCGLGLAAVLGAAGCQVTSGGQTLPSPYYLDDDVEYHPPGAEFKLPKEAAALKAYKAQQQAQKR